MPEPHHRLEICTRLGTLDLRVRLYLHAPWTLLFGPSGSGKSSILRATCGLLPNQGICLERAESGAPNTPLHNTPPHLRHISWAPQRSSLFPHLTVAQNVAFAAESKPTTSSVTDILDLFRLAPLAHRYPRDLSGGERQRVNLARASAAPNTRLLLLDEPFSGIDRTLRDQLIPEMTVWLAHRSIPVLSVSHDVEEALQLNAHVVLIRNGHIESEGPAAKALAPERHRLLKTLSSPN